MRVLIIANPLVGIRPEKKEILDKLIARFKKKRDTVDVTYILQRGQGNYHASRASLEGYDTVFAAGGDGTVSEVASGMIGQTIPLGILAVGTGNGLARSLNMPLNPKQMIDTLIQGKTDAIDCGRLGTHYFFSTAGIGYDASIARDFNQSRKGKTNIFDYIRIGIKNYFLKRPETVSITINKKEVTKKIFALTFCNTRQYGGGAVIAPDANLKSGSLVAVLIPKFSMFSAPFVIKRLFDGTIDQIKGVEFITFKSLKIKRENFGIFHADGETFDTNNAFTVSVQPQALKVIVP